MLLRNSNVGESLQGPCGPSSPVAGTNRCGCVFAPVRPFAQPFFSAAACSASRFARDFSMRRESSRPASYSAYIGSAMMH